MSQPVDPDVSVPIVPRSPDSPRSQIVRQSKQESFTMKNPGLKVGDVYDAINEEIKDIVRCYRFTLKQGARVLTLRTAWKICEGILTIYWLLVDPEDIRPGGRPAIFFKYVKGIIPFARPIEGADVVKVTIRTQDEGSSLTEDFIRVITADSKFQVDKVSQTTAELQALEELDKAEKEALKKKEEQDAQKRLLQDLSADWKDPPAFEQSTFKSSLAVLGHGLDEEDLDRELSSPKEIPKEDNGDKTVFHESQLTLEERAQLNAKGKKRFKEEKIHWQLIQYHKLVSLYFEPVRRVEDPDETQDRRRYKLTDTIYCMNDVQYEFENHYAEVDQTKSFMVQIFALPIFGNDEEASLRCKYEGNYVTVEHPEDFGFLAYLKEGKNGRFAFERTFISSEEKPYRSQQTISRTVTSFLSKLTDLTQNNISHGGTSPLPSPVSRAIKSPPLANRISRKRTNNVSWNKAPPRVFD